jgi:[glutamine synthetase] adenylyltransferase / [glutamine synthetase]-adenylyl-L-tyrosine phosphorylase
MLQLANGHRFRELRCRETLEALKALHDKHIIKAIDYRLLSDGYLFLRRLDHRLRIERDRSIDTFEAEPGRLDGIARALGYSVAAEVRGAKRGTKSGEKLLRDYRKRRDKIRLIYEKFFLQQFKADN